MVGSEMKKLLLTIVLLALAACASGPAKRIYPPKASVQELVAGANGQWTLKVRIDNFSTVPMTFSTLDANLTVAGQDAGKISAQTELTIGPESGDVFSATLVPSTPGKAVVANALASRKSVRYVLTGKITSREPRGDFDFTFESALNPVPGLDGVLR
jgi:uncharacterized lipoprotein YmbA